jgi:hypothetical protein
MTPSVTQYHAEIDMGDRGTIALDAPDRDTINKMVNKTLHANLGGSPTIEDIGRGAFVFHPGIAEGKEPCGWIAELTLPASFGIKDRAETRKRQLQAA